MPVRLAHNRYGKSRVRLIKVSRAGKHHEMRDLCVAIALEGDFESAHVRGENSKVVPTDTMKNTIYALAKDHPIDPIESFATHLGRHFVSSAAQASAATISIEQVAWNRLTFDGKPHSHAFEKGSEERQTCVARLTPKGPTMQSGVQDLILLKTTDSAFSGFPRDRYTTLRETRDRILATSVTAVWDYDESSIDFAAARSAIRDALVRAFAHHMSESVQHTLHAMGEAALGACPGAKRISLSLPNKHCLLVDLSPFGLANNNEVFVPTDEPHGLIEATVERL